jgi:UDP-N-acetylmuramate dehydrogenase
MKKAIDFRRYSSIRIGPVAEVEVIEHIDEENERYSLIGGANNLLLSPAPPPLAILGKAFDFIRIEGDTLIVGAAVSTGRLLSFARRHDIGGFEFLAKLPGTIGGAVKMNAGVKEDEIAGVLRWVRTHKGLVPKDKLGLAYRKSDIDAIVYEAGFAIRSGFDEKLRKRLLALRKNQPKDPSAGSCFKNPPGDFAGRLLEAVGLRGYRIGDAAFSEVHANFLVNLGSATFDDAMALIKLAKRRVYEEFGVKLEEEIIIV